MSSQEFGGWIRDSSGNIIGALSNKGASVYFNQPSVSVQEKVSRFGNAGQRIFSGRMGTFNNVGGQTFQITTALETSFTAVRPIFANTSGILSPYCTAFAVSVIANTTDLNNSGGIWINGTQNGQPTFGLAVAPNNSGQRIAYTVTDWVPIASLPRTDGGEFPLIIIRAYFPDANTTFPVYGNGTDVFTNWANKPDGRIWVARNQLVAGVGTPSLFTTTTNQNQSAIVGVQYLTETGNVVNVMGVGDSITEGYGGTYIGEGFVGMAAEAASFGNGLSLAVQYSDCGWSGQPEGSVSNGFGFANRLIDIINSPVCPDIIVFPNGSPNDVTGTPTTITASNIESFGLNFGSMLAACKSRNVMPIVWTWLPSNTNIKTYGTSDSLRLALNQSVLNLSNSGTIVVDTALEISGVIDSTGQVQFLTGMSTDGIHPNQNGNVLLAPLIQSAIQQVMSA